MPRAVAGTAALALGLSLAAQATTAAATAKSTGTRGVRDRPSNGFSRLAPWNTALPANVPLAANSQAVVDNILQDKTDNYGSWAINTDTYSAPVFTVDRRTPTTTWTYSDCQDKPELAPVLAPSLRNVPTPADLIVSQGTDESVAIYQPDTDTYWDFWRAQQDSAGHWSACWGGKIEHYRHNLGIFPNPLGATATGLPFGAFLIRPEELASGHIDHAINFNTVRTQAGCFSWPATRDDGNTPGADIPCEGQRFRLDPTFDVSTLQSPAAQTIARAMQQYGLILTDTGGALVTQAEDPRPIAAANGGVDPYSLLFDPSGTYPETLSRYVILNDIPVDRLQALPLNYGEPRWWPGTAAGTTASGAAGTTVGGAASAR